MLLSALSTSAKGIPQEIAAEAAPSALLTISSYPCWLLSLIFSLTLPITPTPIISKAKCPLSVILIFFAVKSASSLFDEYVSGCKHEISRTAEKA